MVALSPHTPCLIASMSVCYQFEDILYNRRQKSSKSLLANGLALTFEESSAAGMAPQSDKLLLLLGI
jgi:hypothetical protein